MDKIKNILVLGLGAIGAIYATKFYNYNSDRIKVLLDESRFDRYKENGINFNGAKYNFDYVLPSDVSFKADLIIIATKSNDFIEASEMVANFVKEDTVILSLLNGISSEQILIDKYGKEKVLYSYFIGHASVNQNQNITHDGVGTVVFGESQNSEFSKNVLAVKELFDRLQIKYEIPQDMLSSMWQKFVINIGINQSSAIFMADYGKLQDSIPARELAADLMKEAVNIANRIGINNANNFINKTFEIIDNMPKEAKSSMLQDVENKKQTEVDIFAGEICRLGKIYNIATPKNELAYKKIKSIENSRIAFC